MSHYLFNGLFWNPGYTGSSDAIRLAAMYRHQWSKMDGAPRTAMFSGDIPLKFDNMGISVQFTHDQLGVTQLNEVHVGYAYQIPLSKKLRLGVGLRLGVANYSARYSDLLVWDSGDELFMNDVQNRILPKVGMGLYLHSEKFYVGVSVPTLWTYHSDYDFSIDIHQSSWLRYHLFASAAYVFTINKNFKLKPSVFTKYAYHAPFQADASLTFIIKDMVFLTGGYRSNAAGIAMIELRPIPALRIAYSYDFSTPKYLRIYGGSVHEVMLGYDFVKKNPKFKTPRYF